MGAVLLLPILALHGWPPLNSNEYAYLVSLNRFWHPDFLSNDWTLGSGFADRWTFHLVFGWPTRFLPLEAVAWAGRLLCWGLIVHAFLRAASRLGVGPVAAGLAFLVWLFAGQSFIAGAWIVGTFEAKCVAYACLLYGLSEVWGGKLERAALFFGLTLTWHSAVGLAAVTTFACVVLAEPGGWKTAWKPALWGAAAAAPGVVQLALAVGSVPDSADLLPFITLRIASHVDVLAFSRNGLFVTLLMFAAVVAYSYRQRDDLRVARIRRFLFASGGFAALGVLGKMASLPALMLITPFRLFALFVPLLFFLLLAEWVSAHRHRASSAPVLAAVLAILLCMDSVTVQLKRQASATIQYWAERRERDADDYSRALRWISENLPTDAILAAPPWRGDIWTTGRRACVVSWAAPLVGRPAEWLERVTRLMGPLAAEDGRPRYSGYSEIEAGARKHYRELEEADVLEIRDRYGATHLVTEARYPFPLLQETGTVRVYSLAPQ